MIQVPFDCDVTHLGSTHVGKLVCGEGQPNHCRPMIQSLFTVTSLTLARPMLANWSVARGSPTIVVP